MQLRNEPAEILARLDALRASDAPTSGGASCRTCTTRASPN